jgi:hypothetical protein
VGLGDRVKNMQMLDILYKDRSFLIYELYISTIATVCGGIFFGVISAMMAIVNTASNPIEAICHIPGPPHTGVPQPKYDHIFHKLVVTPLRQACTCGTELRFAPPSSRPSPGWFSSTCG